MSTAIEKVENGFSAAVMDGFTPKARNTGFRGLLSSGAASSLRGSAAALAGVIVTLLPSMAYFRSATLHTVSRADRSEI